MPSGYEFAKLTPSDVPLLKALMRVFADAFGDDETYRGAAPPDGYLASLLGRPHIIVIVATHRGEVVGGLTAYVLDKFERERREIYIYDLAVAAAHRRRGIATGLIRTLVGIARERGAYVIFVQADRGDDAAIALYESLGKGEDVHHFDIPVD